MPTLTSFFRKSKPINFLLIFLFALIFYVFFNFTALSSPLPLKEILGKGAGVLVLIILLFFSNFIISFDKSRGRHTFVLLILLSFLIATPYLLQDITPLIAGLFVVLGLRRILSLQTYTQVKQKLFDGAFCFGIASLFYQPALFFMAVVFAAIFYFANEDYRNWGIPIVAIITILVLRTCYSLLTIDQFFNPLAHYHFDLNTFTEFHHPRFLWPFILVSAVMIWSVVQGLSDTVKQSQKTRRTKYLLVISLLASIAGILFYEHPEALPGSSLLFYDIPAALIVAKYIETDQQPRLKNILLICLIVLSLTSGLLIQWKII